MICSINRTDINVSLHNPFNQWTVTFIQNVQ